MYTILGPWKCNFSSPSGFGRRDKRGIPAVGAGNYFIFHVYGNYHFLCSFSQCYNKAIRSLFVKFWQLHLFVSQALDEYVRKTFNEWTVTIDKVSWEDLSILKDIYYVITEDRVAGYAWKLKFCEASPKHTMYQTQLISSSPIYTLEGVLKLCDIRNPAPKCFS